MRVPLSWLRDYVDFELTPEQLAERLTVLGMEVGEIERIGADFSGIVVGELLEVRPHPRSPKLSLTRVRVAGGADVLGIVCGATNILAGQWVPVALPGAVLPGGRRIEVTTIAGEQSTGMLCSGAELGLTADADGILILAPPDAHDHPQLGANLADIVGDTVLDIDVKPNRGDCMSLIGIAREVAAITRGSVRWPVIELAESGDSTRDHVSVTIEAPGLCSRFVARYADALRVGPAPLVAQLRLTAAGMRPVSNVVDASNYVMLELGKPIHTFDAASVAGGRIVVRGARPGESIETLDHVARELYPDTLLIADERGPLGIAGVMGAASSEISPTTSAVIIESAIFDAASIRRTAQRFALRSEASVRFERGQESRLARLGADRTAQLLAAWAGARVARGAVDTAPADEPVRKVLFRPARVSQLLGTEIPVAEMRDLLARVEIATEPAGVDVQSLTALVPPHRRDVVIEADVAEEIIRVRGYETLAPQLPDTAMPGYRPDPRRLVDELRDLLAGRGLSEVVTYGLIAPEDHARLGIAADDATTIWAENPVSVEHSQLRRSLLPGLLRVLLLNERQRRPGMAVFEVGAIHRWGANAPDQTEKVAILLAGTWPPLGWTDTPKVADIADAKGLLESLFSRLNLGAVRFAPTTAQAGVEHTGRTAALVLDGRDVGRVGDVDPRLLATYDVRTESVVFAQLDIAAISAGSPTAVEVGAPPNLPVLQRDIAVVIGPDGSAGAVAAALAAHGGPNLASATLFDRYVGPPLAEGEVSLAYRLSFQPTSDELTEAELDATVARIAGALKADLGARLRGHGDSSG